MITRWWGLCGPVLTASLAWLPCVTALGEVALAQGASAALRPGAVQASAPSPAISGSPSQASVAEAALLWKQLASAMGPLMDESRSLLIGQRKVKPHDPRWTAGSEKGPPAAMADAKGGIGMRLAALYLDTSSRASPLEDFRWYQGKFRARLTGLRQQNGKVLPRAVRLAEQAERLAELVRGWDAVPAGFPPSGVNTKRDWPGYCLQSMDAAIARQDLALLKEMADELAAAAFALADLHRWADFLLENNLVALDFQARCESLFRENNKSFEDKPYDPLIDIGYFPAAMSLGQGLSNFLEIDRQADLLFQVPDGYLKAARGGAARVCPQPVVRAALWMPPDLRQAFMLLRSNLSPANRATWDVAAHSPFDRTYLANMLFRAGRTDSLESLGTVLRRFDSLHPTARTSSLMGVIFYRGGDFTGGNEWDDRFDPRLLAAAGRLTGDNQEALAKADEFTKLLIGDRDARGRAGTLHEALDTHRLDSSRATDLIGALLRNSGRTGFYNLRLSGGTAAHTVAAATIDPTSKTLLVADGLDRQVDALDRWPQDYLGGCHWPAGSYAGTPPPYAAELHVRGLNSYVWVEGCILRGPNKDTFVQAVVPYVPRRAKPALTKAESTGPARLPD